MSPHPVAPTMPAERIGAGRALVLIGGGLTGWASWQPHAQQLASHREVVRLQLLSVHYGLENRPLPHGYGVAMESAALMAALDGLDMTAPVDLVAWSFGALVTLDFALDHPERVRTLTLIEPPAIWTLPDRGRDMADVRALTAILPEIEGDDVSTDALKSFLRTVALVPPDVEAESVPQWDSWLRHRRSLRSGSAPFDHTDDLSRLRAFPRPVLLVTGHGTSPFLRAAHDTLAENLPRVTTLELPGGHAPHLAAMDRFLEELERFQELDHAGAPPPRDVETDRSAQHRRGTGGSTDASARPKQHEVPSRDGTRIAFWVAGDGPPLLLVHGASADHTTTWRLVRHGLERAFTVHAMDRRGRGGSGDSTDYALASEAEDVAAVAGAIREGRGEPVGVLGHSFGALVALEAARLTPAIHRLILYEGVPLRGEDESDRVVEERLSSCLARGDMEGILLTLFRDVAAMNPDEIDLLRHQQNAWTRRLANARTVPREITSERRYAFEPRRFTEMRASTLLLVGENSPPRALRNARGVAAGLPDARVVVLPGQQHTAMYTAPEAFVQEVVRFLQPPSAD